MCGRDDADVADDGKERSNLEYLRRQVNNGL